VRQLETQALERRARARVGAALRDLAA
jgi:hypothetical protein